MVPIMPGTRVEQAGRRVLQCLAKSISAVMLESDAGVVPSTQRHDPAEKQRRIFKGCGNRFPPANAASYGSQMPESLVSSVCTFWDSLSI